MSWEITKKKDEVFGMDSTIYLTDENQHVIYNVTIAKYETTNCYYYSSEKGLQTLNPTGKSSINK